MSSGTLLGDLLGRLHDALTTGAPGEYVRLKLNRPELRNAMAADGLLEALDR